MELDSIEEYCLTRIGYLVEKWWDCDELFKAAKLARVFNHIPEQLREYKKSSFDFHKNIECFLVKVYEEHSENFATLLNNFLTMRANEEITDTFYYCLRPLHLTLIPGLEVKFSSLETEKRRERRRWISTDLDIRECVGTINRIRFLSGGS